VVISRVLNTVILDKETVHYSQVKSISVQDRCSKVSSHKCNDVTKIQGRVRVLWGIPRYLVTNIKECLLWTHLCDHYTTYFFGWPFR